MDTKINYNLPGLLKKMGLVAVPDTLHIAGRRRGCSTQWCKVDITVGVVRVSLAQYPNSWPDLDFIYNDRIILRLGDFTSAEDVVSRYRQEELAMQERFLREVFSPSVAGVWMDVQ
jgi:hypothetical protein